MSIKPKSSEISLRELISVINKYNLGLFIMFVTAGLIFCVLALNSIVFSTYDQSQDEAAGRFDKATIVKISQLRPSSEKLDFTLPAGRTDPFNE